MSTYRTQIESTNDGEIWWAADDMWPAEEHDGTPEEYGRACLEAFLDNLESETDWQGKSIEPPAPGTLRALVWHADDPELGHNQSAVVVDDHRS